MADNALDDLFGSDDDDELPQQQAAVNLEDSDDEAAAAPAAATAPAPKMDMKARLAALAKAKRDEAAGPPEQKKKKKDGDGDKGKKRKSQAALVDFGESDEEGEQGGGGEEEEEGDDEEGEAKRRRTARQAANEESAREREAAGPAVELDENDEAAMLPTDADRDFIVDDVGVDFGDQEDLGTYAEAEEAGEGEDEFDAMFNRKKKKEGMSDGEAKATVEALLAQMEVAVEEDHKAFEDSRPAVYKLRLLSKVVDVLSTKRLHSELLDAGLLGVLKAWIEPMSDGTLPNAKVRETVLRLLHQLPIDCSLEDRKEQLKKSGLGRIIMFLFKVPDETPSNRRLAKELVERWSRPILAPNRARDLGEDEQERILAARQARQQRQAAVEAAQRGSQPDEEEDEEEGGMRRRGPKFGEPGFRYHAFIPQAAALDYVKAPTSNYAMPEMGGGKGGKKDKDGDHKLAKKLKVMAKGGRTGRAAIASVEGRNVTIQH